MIKLSDYKNDLRLVLSYALQEYNDSHLSRKETSEYPSISMKFNSLSAEISWVVVEKDRIYLKMYAIKDKDNHVVCKFSLGYMAVLFARSSEWFRNKLLEDEKIQGIITLKQSIFDHYVLPASIILFGEFDSRIWLSSAESVEQLLDLFIGNIDDKTRVYYTNELSSRNFLPEFYNGDDQIIEEKYQGVEVKELGDIADIISGKGARRDDYREQGIPFLRARDLKEGKICKPDVYIKSEDAIKYARQLLQTGDILITKHFGQNKIALVTENDIPAIASNMLYIIRPLGVSEKYLYKYLTSETGNEVFNKQLNRIQHGSVIPSIALSDLIHVKVPLFDDHTMQMIDIMNSVSSDNSIEITRSFIDGFSTYSEKKICEMLIDSFVAAGWKKDGFIWDTVLLSLKDLNTRWRPDIVYHDRNLLVVIEIIKPITNFEKNKLTEISQILQDESGYFVILTTGYYFEVHKSGSDKSLKMTNPPSIEDILRWEKEVE